MALYSYEGFSKDGKKTSGFIDAASSVEVKRQLDLKGILPIKIVLAQAGAQESWWTKIFGARISEKEKILFTKQLVIMLRAGIPLLPALELLIEQFKGSMRTMIVAMKDDIKEGVAFYAALAKYPRVFEPIYVQLVRAGEASGNLEVILDRLVEYMERRQAMRSRIRSALAYPALQLFFSMAVVALLMVYVVPKMSENFATMGQKLPGITLALMGISSFFVNYWLLILLFLIILVISFFYWRSTESGARTLDTLKIKLPFIQFFARMGAVVQFSQTLGMLMQSGVILSESLDIVVKIIDNKILANTLNEARDKIIKQGKIAQYLKQTDIFPPIAIYLLKTGEETGKLDVMLLTVAKTYETELNERADTLASMITPIMLVVMAVIVGFIVIALMLPMAQMGVGAGM